MNRRIDINTDTETGKVDIKAPWGDYRQLGSLGFIGFARDQLAYYLAEDDSPNPAVTQADIAAYDEIIATGSDETARSFLDRRGEERRKSGGGQPVRGAAVIAMLKQEGLWQTKTT